MDGIRGISIIPLNEKNYPTWKVQMKMQLMKENILNIVQGTEQAPPAEAEEKVKSNYISRRDKALATIVLAVDPKLLYLLGDPCDPAVVWNILQNTFMKKTWSNKLRLKRRLYNLKLKPGESLQEHLKEFVEIFGELAVLDSAVADEDKVITLLSSLPDSFSTIVTALETFENVPTWEVVTERLLHEDNKLQESNQYSNKALVNVKYAGKKTIVCHFCNKPGHIKKNCYSYLRRLNQEDSSSNSGKASYASEGNELQIGKTTLIASAFYTENSYCWIIDSGASQHMCNLQSNF